VVLTGFNTDIQYGGSTYHVQTEDKGESNPQIESLVYAHGEILYSRRTAYHELLEQGVKPNAVATLMERQHHSIVEAIRRGMLSRLTGEEGPPIDGDDTTIARSSEVEVVTPSERSLDEVILDYLQAQKARAHLVLQAVGSEDFVYGEQVMVEVVALNSHDSSPQDDVEVTVVFKSTAEPRRMLLAEGRTDDAGTFAAEARLPEFNGGTSAVVITAQSSLGQSEVKHLVHR
jgi:hypothetical protein